MGFWLPMRFRCVFGFHAGGLTFDLTANYGRLVQCFYKQLRGKASRIQPRQHSLLAIQCSLKSVIRLHLPSHSCQPTARMVLPSTVPLNNGTSIPAVGFGTWQAPPNQVETAVEIALRSGYRHIDCAAIYRNEAEVGAGIKKSGVNRDEIFITTKLWNTHHEPDDVEGALDQSLQRLGLDYVDLYLMHWPVYDDQFMR